MTAVQREAPEAALGATAATANSLLMVPNALALALGAGAVAVADIRVLLPAAGVAGLLTAAWLGPVPWRALRAWRGPGRAGRVPRP